jgi:uridine kinase
MTYQIHWLLNIIKEIPLPCIIAISGYGWSGKSTLAESIKSKSWGNVVSVDSFWTNNPERLCWDNIDYTRLEKEVLIPFIKSTEVKYGHFDWGTGKIGNIRILDNNRLLIIEWVWLFRAKLMKYFSYTIWIDCPLEQAINQWKKRDREIYKNPQDEKWDNEWKRNDISYYQKYRPQTLVNKIVSINELYYEN